MGYSSLATYKKISPNKDSPRRHPINRISIHCVVGQCYISTLGDWFSHSSTEASSNYGIDTVGKIGVFVDEGDRSWCTSSYDNDHRAITIEVASDSYDPYRVNSAALNSLINLLVDICKRYNKKLVWIPDKNKALSYNPKSNEFLMTVHRWFANKACPGDYLYNLHGQIAETVNKKLGESSGSSDDPSGGTGVYKKVVLNVRYLGRYGYDNNPAQVRTVQRLLKIYGYKGKDGLPLSVDSNFGVHTEYAVTNYQKDNKVQADGVVGPVTWKLLIGSD